MQTHDIIIIGSGISGLATARALALRAPGLAARTLLIDQRGEAGDALTEPLNTQALMLLEEELRFNVDVPGVELKRVRFRYGEQSREVFFDRPWLAVSYEAFHRHLYQQLAQEMEVRVGETIKAVRVEGNLVMVEGSPHRFRANLVIGADGASSLVRKAVLERGEILSPGISNTTINRALIPDGMRISVDLVAQGTPLQNQSCLEYDFSMLAHGHAGYSWAMPSLLDNDEQGIQVGLYEENPAQSTQESVALLSKHSQRFRGSTELGQGITPHRLHYYHPGRPISAPHLMLVGEAAGLSPFLGDGLEQCLEYGPIAANYIHDSFEAEDFSMQGYSEALRKSSLGRQMMTARKLTENLFGHDWEFWISLLLRRQGVCDLLTKQVSGTGSVHQHRFYMTFNKLLHRLLGDTSLPTPDLEPNEAE